MGSVNELESRLAHLHRRAGFGATPSELAASVALGYDGAVAAMLDRSAPDAADAIAVPNVPLNDSQVETVEERKARQKARKQGREDITMWWLQRMVVSDKPLREKLTWFWHDHFATSSDKVNEPRLMLDQNLLLRSKAAGGFEDLVQSIAKDPAMLLWLDSNQNRKGKPNENFARELMELFTIGIGSYSDADVQEAARAFTGWRTDRGRDYKFVPGQADLGPKTVLGNTLRTGEEVISMLVRRPEAGRFIAFKAWNYFAYPISVSDPIAGELGAAFSADLDVTGLLRRVFTHPQFASQTARQNLVKEPVAWMVGLLRATGVRPDELLLQNPSPMQTLETLNQEPFAPPSVGGWPNNNYWLSTTSSSNRIRFAYLVANTAKLGWLEGASAASRPDVLAQQLSIASWTPASLSAIRKASNPRQQLLLAAVSPEYVLA
jgi:uncharacterized protein (DUF1800 family)